MKIRRIVPDICSNDLEKSKQFYGDFLGLKLVMDMDWILCFASESNQTAQINILPNDNKDVTNANVFITIEVFEIDAAYEKAIANNYEIVYPITNEPWKVRRFFMKDPNGVTINIMCHL